MEMSVNVVCSGWDQAALALPRTASVTAPIAISVLMSSPGRSFNGPARGHDQNDGRHRDRSDADRCNRRAERRATRGNDSVDCREGNEGGDENANLSELDSDVEAEQRQGDV